MNSSLFYSIIPHEGSKEFHVAWTGVAEIIFGLWLTIAGVGNVFGYNIPTVSSIPGATGVAESAFALLLLTIIVTPANMYMYTHGAGGPPDVNVPIPVQFHYVRGFMQMVLFTFFYEMAIPIISHI